MSHPRLIVENQNKKLHHELEKVKTELTQAKNTLSQVQNQNNQLSTEKAAANEKIIASEKIIEQLRAENLALQENVKKLQKTVTMQNVDIEEYKNEIEQNNDLNLSLLNNAASGNLQKVEKALFPVGADINAVDHTGVSALLLSVVNNQKEIVEYLLQRNADVEIHDKDGNKLMDIVATRDYIDADIANLVISNYPKTDGGIALKAAYQIACDNKKQIIANHLLLQSAKQGIFEFAKFALKNGADVNAKDHFETALHKAAYYGHTAIVELLLQHHCKTDITDGNGSTAIRIAANDEIKKLLTENDKLKEKSPSTHRFFNNNETTSAQTSVSNSEKPQSKIG